MKDLRRGDMLLVKTRAGFGCWKWVIVGKYSGSSRSTIDDSTFLYVAIVVGEDYRNNVYTNHETGLRKEFYTLIRKL